MIFLSNKIILSGLQELRILVLRLSFFLFVGLFSFAASAKLTQSIDRTDIHAGESFQLTLQIEEDSDAQPDLSFIPKEFTILSNSQYQNMSYINGVSKVTKGWKIKLSTLSTGKIVIPSITVGKHKSNPISLFIKDTSDRVDLDGQKKAIFVESRIDQAEVYVQQQIIFTVKLFRAINTHYARLSEPFAGESIIEKLGDDVQYDKQIDGTRYVVTERRYAIFPQKSGKMSIESVNFTADINDTSQRNRNRFLNTTRPISVSSKSIDVSVLVQPKGSAIPWMPASEIVLVDKWSNNSSDLKVGEPVTWTLLLYAQGLSESQLPEIKLPKVEGLQFYPDTPQKERQINEKGILGQRVEKLAVIPSQAGKITIPEIKLSWWDTKNKKQQIATLASKTFNVIETVQKNNPSATAEKIGPLPKINTPTDDPNLHYWQLSTAFLFILWLMTLAIYIRSKNQKAIKQTARNDNFGKNTNEAPTPQSAQQLKKALLVSLKQENLPLSEQNLIQWADSISSLNIHSIGQIIKLVKDDELLLKLKNIDKNRYSKSIDQPIEWLTENDISMIQTNLIDSLLKEKQQEIPPLYPS